jgi:hypothetical protein
MQTRRTFLGVMLAALPAWLLRGKPPEPSVSSEGQPVEWSEYQLDQDISRVPFIEFEHEVSIEEIKRLYPEVEVSSIQERLDRNLQIFNEYAAKLMYPPAPRRLSEDSGAAWYRSSHKREI